MNRGNIVVLQEKETNAQVWISSKKGSHTPAVVQKWLATFPNFWNDAGAMTKELVGEICFAVIPDCSSLKITTRMNGNDHEILVVCIDTQTVFLITEPELIDGKVPYGYGPQKGRHWGFDAYCKLKKLPQI